MKLKISNQCVCFYPIKIRIKKRSYEEKKKLIQHNVTYKKILKNKIKKRKRTWLIAIRNFNIYLNVINVEIIKLMEIYIVFWNR